MHTSVFSLFLASHPGMLQTLPLKITSSRSLGSRTLWDELVVVSIRVATPPPIDWIPVISLCSGCLLNPLCLILNNCHLNPFYVVFHTLGESNTFQLLSFTSYFGKVSILGNQLSMYGLVMVYKIRFHGAQDNTQEVR
jgi:hypothetical protein